MLTMSNLIILFAVLTFDSFPIEIVHAGKLQTEDIEIANSIIQRLHKLQDKANLNERIKKQRLEEVNNHNERVNFLHKLGLEAQEVYSPTEKKGVNDLLHKLKIVDINDKNNMVQQKSLAFIQGLTDSQKGIISSQLRSWQDNKDIQRIKPTSPTLRDLENMSVTFTLPQLENNNNPASLSSSWTEKRDRNNDIPVLSHPNINEALVPMPDWKVSRSNKPLLHILSSDENIAVLNENSDDNNKKEINRILKKDKEQNNVLEQVLKSLQQHKNNNINKIKNISWKSRNKGYYDGFLGDLNIQKSLNKYQKETAMKGPQNNYFQGSTYEETQENNKDIDISNDKLDGYSKVFLVLDPEAITSKNNRYEADKIISKLSAWAANLNKYWAPKQVYNKQLDPYTSNGVQRRQSEYVTNENGNRRKDRFKRHTTDYSKIRTRSKHHYQKQRTGGRIYKKKTTRAF